MKSTRSAIGLMILFVVTAAHAELYKWVGADGRISYSDTPPPKSAARVEQKSLTENAVGSSNLPYDLAEAVKNHPVTLYTSARCDPCDDARLALKNRGIPFTEKTVTTNEDLARLKQVANETNVPVMMVGRSKQAGFEAGAWNAALSAAGYPVASKLPMTYRHPAAEAASPRPAVEKAAQAGRTPPDHAAASASSGSLPAATGNAPPGFRF